MTTIIGTLPFQLQNGTTADATQVMADFNKILTDVNANAAGNGVNTDITALTALITPITPAQGGTPVYFASTSGGSANALTVASPTPSGFTLAVGKRISFVAGTTNTAAATLNVNSTGATAIRKISSNSGPIALQGGEIVINNTYECLYDGTYFILLNPTPQFSNLTSIASAATTDLGTINSHNINITGTTGITSFGSSADVSFPIYFVRFESSLTLTHNGSSFYLPGAANIVTTAGDWAIAEYVGSGNWIVISYLRLNGTAVVNPTPLAGASGVTITNNAGTPNTSIDITAASAVMINPTGNVPIYATSISLTANCTTTGANGLDAGSLAAATWYYIYLISNGSATASLVSTSATTPTMPSGYIYKALVGTFRTATGSANFMGLRQRGRLVQYVVGLAQTTVPQIIISGSSGSVSVPTWTGTAIATWVPSAAGLATAIKVSLFGAGASNVQSIAAPNNSYGAYSSTSNPPPLATGANTGAGANNYTTVMGDFVLESGNIYYASNGAGNGLVCVGWELDLNVS